RPRPSRVRSDYDLQAGALGGGHAAAQGTILRWRDAGNHKWPVTQLWAANEQQRQHVASFARGFLAWAPHGGKGFFVFTQPDRSAGACILGPAAGAYAKAAV